MKGIDLGCVLASKYYIMNEYHDYDEKYDGFFGVVIENSLILKAFNISNIHIYLS